MLLTVGALAGLGQLSLPWMLLAAVGGSLVANLLWYAVGRRYGSHVLATICRLSLEPDSRARRAKELFLVDRLRALVIGKFFFEVNAAVAALAGSTRIAIGQFLLYDIVSARPAPGRRSGCTSTGSSVFTCSRAGSKAGGAITSLSKAFPPMKCRVMRERIGDPSWQQLVVAEMIKTKRLFGYQGAPVAT